MAAPDYVPPSRADQPRATLPIPPSRRWTATRPGDLQRGQPTGRGMGRQGPDQGYALNLAARFADELRLAPGEHATDVVAGCVAVAMRRASMFGRAPIKADLEFAFGLFAYLDDAPDDLVEFRRRLFKGAAHDYWEQRAIVDGMPEATVRLTPADVRARLSDWRALLSVTG
jgi:hypothetical protein